VTADEQRNHHLFEDFVLTHDDPSDLVDDAVPYLLKSFDAILELGGVNR
jgi:hypothetical protein